MPGLGSFHVTDRAVARRLAVEATLESIDVRRTNKDYTRIAVELAAIDHP